EEQLTIVFIALLTWFTTSNTFKLRIIRFRRTHDGDIDVEERAGIGGHIHVWFVTTGHINADDAPMTHSVVPGAHGMVGINGGIVEFSDITGGVDTGNAGFHIFIDDHTTI